MAYDEKLAGRIRELLAGKTEAEEKKMFGGLAFMVNSKMCVGIIRDELMCRLDPAFQEKALELPGCRIMKFTGRPMNGYVMVDPSGMSTRKELGFWIDRALEYNPLARSSVKKKKKIKRM